MARERGLTVDADAFGTEMEKQRQRAREAHKSIDILVSEDSDGADATVFVGYDPANLQGFTASCLDLVEQNDKSFLVLDQTPFYAEMGGQTGDSGSVFVADRTLVIENVLKNSSGRFLHQLKSKPEEIDFAGQKAILNVDLERRKAIQRHHTATHVLHWALREVLGDHIRQAGSLVEPDRLRFDFSHFEESNPTSFPKSNGYQTKAPAQRPLEAYETCFPKNRRTYRFFGDKYGETVRVVDLADGARNLRWHPRILGREIGSLRDRQRIRHCRRHPPIEAVAGLSAYQWADERITDQ